MSGRNPFPSPRFEDDFTLSGFKPQQRAFKEPCHITQLEEPWSHLHDTPTFASSQHSVLHQQNKAPKDYLDLQLKSIYNHHTDVFVSKNQTMYQKETVSDPKKTETGYAGGKHQILSSPREELHLEQDMTLG